MSFKNPAAQSPGRVVFWIALILSFLAVSLAAAIRADAATAVRTVTLNATPPFRTLTVENENGDVQILAGPSFSSQAEITATAANQKDAERLVNEANPVFRNEAGNLTLEISGLPRGASKGWSDKGKVNVRITVTLPASVPSAVSVVNGSVKVKNMTGRLEIDSVNGPVEIEGTRGPLALQTVNGSIKGTVASLASDGIHAETVNGNIRLVLPPDSSFEFFAETMNGDIASTFSLPPRILPAPKAVEMSRKEREELRKEIETLKREARQQERELREGNTADAHAAMAEVQAELAKAMAQLREEMAQMSSEIARSAVVDINRSYKGAFGKGGAPVNCKTLNGKILLLTSGTSESEAKPLVSRRKTAIAMVSPVAPVPPVPPVPPIPPIPPKTGPMPPEPPDVPSGVGGEPVVKGDVQGDFYTSVPLGDIRLGRVNGSVKAITHSGDIRITSSAREATLSTLGGDIRIGDVGGDLKASSNGGDVRAGAVAGNASLETMGGDVTLDGATGFVKARTQGGDIKLRKVRGPVTAETMGGSVSCEFLKGNPAEESKLTTMGGDITVTLPSNFRADVEIRITGGGEENQVRSDFGEITVSAPAGHRPGPIRATGKLNGGGPRLFLQTAAGRVSLRKGPTAD